MPEYLNDETHFTPGMREQWAMRVALEVEQSQGEGAPLYIAKMVLKFVLGDNRNGIDTWHAVARAYDALRARPLQLS